MKKTQQILATISSLIISWKGKMKIIKRGLLPILLILFSILSPCIVKAGLILNTGQSFEYEFSSIASTTPFSDDHFEYASWRVGFRIIESDYSIIFSVFEDNTTQFPIRSIPFQGYTDSSGGITGGGLLTSAALAPWQDLQGVFKIEVVSGAIELKSFVAATVVGGDYYEQTYAVWCETSVGDSDLDSICDDVDNCIFTANLNQEDADSDGTGDACDADTVYGTISGDIQSGVTVDIYTTSCGGDILEATTETDANGYYSFGDLSSQRYLLVAEETGYSFSTVSVWVDIPQDPIESYDFTATWISTCDSVDRFLDNGDGTVKDCRTDLIWLKNANCYGGLLWATAMSTVDGLNHGECGLTDGSVAGDWHLGTKEELQGIGTDPPATWPNGDVRGYGHTWIRPGSPFLNVVSSFYWTSTPLESDNDAAWVVYSVTGLTNYELKDDILLMLVWPVRSGN